MKFLLPKTPDDLKEEITVKLSKESSKLLKYYKRHTNMNDDTILLNLIYDEDFIQFLKVSKDNKRILKIIKGVNEKFINSRDDTDEESNEPEEVNN